MRLLDVADTLDSDDMLAVYRGEGRKTGVYAGVVDFLCCWVVLGNDNGAGAATAFAAASVGRKGVLVFLPLEHL